MMYFVLREEQIIGLTIYVVLNEEYTPLKSAALLYIPTRLSALSQPAWQRNGCLLDNSNSFPKNST